MSFASKYNKRKFDFDTSNLEFKSLSDLYNDNGKDKIYPVHAMFINTKGKFSDNPVIATNDYLVDFPSHMTDTVREILDDPQSIEDINAGLVGFKIYTYQQKKYNKQCFSIEFVDMN